MGDDNAVKVFIVVVIVAGEEYIAPPPESPISNSI